MDVFGFAKRSKMVLLAVFWRRRFCRFPRGRLGMARTIVVLGAGELLVISMNRDGSKAGFNLGLT